MKCHDVPFKVTGPTPWKDEHGQWLNAFGVEAKGYELRTLSFSLDKYGCVTRETKDFRNLLFEARELRDKIIAAAKELLAQQ